MNKAYIDGQNLRYGTVYCSNSWEIDLMRFRIYLQDKYMVDEAYYFIGAFDSAHQDLYNYIQKSGYILIFREHSNSALSKKKGNVDTDIVFSIMRDLMESDDAHKVILVSGDGDYWKIVKYLIDGNRFYKLLAPNKQRTSSLYRKVPGCYVAYLDDDGIKKKIERNKKTGSP